MRTFLAAAVVAVISTARADEATDRSLKAVHASSYLYLRLGEGTERPFAFSVDHFDEMRTEPLRADSAVTTDGGWLQIHMHYLNPLKYTWKTTEETAEDPTYESARKFVDSLNGLLDVVAPATKAPSDPGDAVRGMLETAFMKLDVAGAEDEPLYAPELVEWSFLANLPTAKKCIERTRQADGNRFGEFRAALGKADARLYGAGDANPGRPSTTFNADAVAAVKVLLDASSMDELRAALKEAGTRLTTLKESNKAAAAELDAVKTQLAAIKWKTTDCASFDAYTNGVIGRFDAAAREVLAARQDLAKNLSELEADVAKRLPKGEGGGNYFALAGVEVPEGKVKDVTIVVRRREVKLSGDARTFSVTEQQETKGTVRVLRHQGIVLEFAPGLAFAWVRYRTFETTEVDGRTVVAEAKNEDNGGVSAVAMLNVIPRIRRSTLLLPIVQLGLGTGKDYPLLLAGGGARLGAPYNVSLTIGAAWTWQRTLQSLEQGDPVRGTADIEKDVRHEFQPKPSFYLAVQRGF